MTRTPHLGPWINVAYDDRFGVCLCAGNVQTNAGMNPRAKHVEMKAIAEREVALNGTVAVLFGFTRRPGQDYLDPASDFLDAMEIVERDYALPPGARLRRLPIQTDSYLDCAPDLQTVDQYIDVARRLGFRILMVEWAAFSSGPGHFRIDLDKFPNGLADVKRMNDRIRAAGLKVGLHLHYNKAVRTDRYVTPVPDPRLHKLRRFKLAGPIDVKADTITVDGCPEGATLTDQRRVIQVGNELIEYTNYTAKVPYQFTGCKRGCLGTKAAAHQAGDEVGLLDVDEWPLFIRYDQDTDIQPETARRIAEIYQTSGPYDMVYFDGAEDVHWPFWYHVSQAQYACFKLWKEPPVAAEAACSFHFGWHMNTRGNAYDAAANSQVAEFARRIPARMAPYTAPDFSRINFGWLAKMRHQPDTLEYVCSQAAAWDCPISLMLTELGDVYSAKNPRLEDGIQVLKLWLDAMADRNITAEHRQMLRTMSPSLYRYVSCRVQDEWFAGVRTEKGLTEASRAELLSLGRQHHLFINEAGKHELVPIDPVPAVAGGSVKAYTFQRTADPETTYVLLWATNDPVQLRLHVPAERVALMRPFGRRLAAESAGAVTLVEV
ncbi:MAG: hypothetical protein A2W31_07000 [Planctomycetes bacterium RBG_16_64_10]|nr:MAG: hypothetical protein A2W31_07000 [Planctomycetes bacterium RBG_16_64_10]